MEMAGQRGLVGSTFGTIATIAFAVLAIAAGLSICIPPLVHAQVSTTTTATSTLVEVDTATASSTATTTPAVATTPPTTKNTNDGIESQVRSYFASSSVMITIASCESGYRQFNSSGNPLNGGSGGMIGIFQISSSTHASVARELAMDIGTVAGNMAYAKYLYEREGTEPWISSFPCWSTMGTTSSSTLSGPSTALLHSNLVLGVVSPEVMVLQQLLNKTRTPVASSGPGSAGQETALFGTLTKIAVQAFQCSQHIICTGDEYSTGYGAVGPATRAALLSPSGNTMTPAVVPAPLNTPPLPGSTPPTPDESAQIAQLRIQIAQLEEILRALIKARNS